MAKTAIVFGATSGIGAEIVRLLDQRGYRLTLVDLDPQRLKDQAAGLVGSATHVLNQNDPKAVEAFCDLIEASQAPDIAIVNAGIIAIGDLADITRQDVTSQIQINLTSAALLIQSLAKTMRTARRGHILATVSMGGIVSLRGSATYSASKFGLRGLLWGLRDELLRDGVNVTGVYPAGVDTVMLRHEAMHGGSALNFVGKPVSAETVAHAFMRAIDRPRLEVYVPYSESISTRFVAAYPWILGRLYPLLEWVGERGRRAFLKRIGQGRSR